MFADGDRPKRWMFTDNLWWDHDQIVVPEDQEAKRMILQDSPYTGHLGIRKTVKNILRYSHGLTYGQKLQAMCSIALVAKSVRVTIRGLAD